MTHWQDAVLMLETASRLAAAPMGHLRGFPRKAQDRSEDEETR